MHSIIQFGAVPGPSSGRSACPFRVVAAAASALAVLLGPVGSALSQEVPAAPASSVVAGGSVFGAKGCVDCHSYERLREMLGLHAESVPETWRFYVFAADMWNHMPVMASSMDERGIERPYLDGREVADLVVFLFAGVSLMPAGDAETGRELFAAKRCIKCHQVDGVGGIIGPHLDLTGEFHSPIRLSTAMWNHGPEMAESMQDQEIERRSLTGAELADLYAYFSTSAETEQEITGPVLPGSAGSGRSLYAIKGCRGCHGTDGRGGQAPSLARRDRDWNYAQFAAAMWNKSPAMMAAVRAGGRRAPRLTTEEMADIIAFLYSLRYFEGSGDAEVGRRLVRESGCLECHMLDGRGRTDAEDLAQARGLDTPVAVIAALWNHVVLLDELRQRSGQPWPTFSDEEMADLVSFFVAGR